MKEVEAEHIDSPWAAEDGPEIVFDASNVREISATNLVDEHQSERAIKADLAKGATDLGEGFLIQDEPVLIQRDASGGIVKITPISEIPGVHFDGQVMTQDPERLTAAEKELQIKTVEERETPVPLGTAEREKLRHIITTRLYNHYKTEASLRNRAKWNPFRDGIPEAPLGSPEFLQPSKELPLIPVTPAQVYDYLLKHVIQRMRVVDKKQGRGLADIAIRIE